jgi:hypothetical protein
MIMATSHEQSAATVTPEEALNVLHRKLVSIHYGLAEHGPTDPRYDFTPFDGGSVSVTCTFTGPA